MPLRPSACTCMHLHTHTSSARRGSMLLRQHAGLPPTARAAPAARPGPPHRGRQTQCRTGACTRTQHSARDQPAYGPTTALGRRPRAQRPRAAAHSPSTPPASRIVGERGRVGKVSRKVSRNLFHSTSKRTQSPPGRPDISTGARPSTGRFPICTRVDCTFLYWQMYAGSARVPGWAG